MLIAGVIGEVKPGPPRLRKSPLQVVRRMMSYVTKSSTKPMNPPVAVAAAPAAPLVPPATTVVVIADAAEATEAKAYNSSTGERCTTKATHNCPPKGTKNLNPF